MATTKQSEDARRNIKKAQAAWKNMSHRQRALRQPEGRGRAEPGSLGTGEYYRIVVRPKEDFVSFRVQDVGDPGGLERVAGHRRSGSWATQAWLVSKQKAHVKDNVLIADDDDAKKLFESLSSKPELVKGDIFKAKDRRNVPEREKPTAAQQKAYASNIKKAQAARKSPGKKKFTTAEARRIGKQAGIDFDEIDLEQFRMGLAVELEHGARDPETNVTNDDLGMTARIAWAHLKELPDYYSRLQVMEGEDS